MFTTTRVCRTCCFAAIAFTGTAGAAPLHSTTVVRNPLGRLETGVHSTAIHSAGDRIAIFPPSGTRLFEGEGGPDLVLRAASSARTSGETMTVKTEVETEVVTNQTATASPAAGEDRMLGLKGLAVALIATSSLIGVIPPIYGWSSLMEGGASDTPSHNFFRLRGFTAGIMVSLALVHIIADAFELLDGVAGDYPVAAIFIMLGIFIMILVERTTMDILSAKTADAESQLHTIVCCHAPAHNHAHRPNHTCTHHTHMNSNTHDLEEHLINKQTAVCSVGSAPHQHGGVPCLHTPRTDPAGGSADCCAVSAASPEREEAGAGGSAHDVAVQKQKPVVMMSMLELGIVVHSVVIGMDLGVMTENRSAMVGLIVALAFHQLFEGLGLGACVAAVRKHITGAKTTAIVALFVCTFPLGVAGGTALTFLEHFNSKDPLKVWLQGSLDALSGGILLYVAIVHFIAEDFSRTDVNRRENLGLRWQMLFFLALGATVMALLGLWA